MRNSQGSGEIVDLTAPVGGITSGDIAVIGALVVVASHDAAEGQKFVGESQGLFLLPKVPTEAWAEGDAIYWDAVGKQATTAPGPISLGLAAAAASNPSTRGSVLLPARASSGGTPGGNPNEFQYNNSGAFGGTADTYLSTMWRSGGTGGVTFILESGSAESGVMQFLVNPGELGAAAINLITDGSRVVADWNLLSGANKNVLYIDNETPELDMGDRSVKTWVFGQEVHLQTGNPPSEVIVTAGAAKVNGTLNVTTNYQANGTPGVVSGSFTTNDGKTVTVTQGIITSIVP